MRFIEREAIEDTIDDWYKKKNVSQEDLSRQLVLIYELNIEVNVKKQYDL